MSEPKIRTGRLRKLAKHLRSKHCVHNKFDFGTVARGQMDKDGNYCGSAGCAMGEFPAVWPNEWRWMSLYAFITRVNIFHKSQRDDNSKPYIDSHIIADFFSITVREVEHLFFPMAQNMIQFGGKKLGDKTTAIDVADNIDAFIKVAS